MVANCGLMLRACSRYKSLVWVILLLKSDDILQFFDFMQSKHFEVLSDAFVTFKELLRHDDLTAKFLEENHEEVRHSTGRSLDAKHENHPAMGSGMVS